MSNFNSQDAALVKLLRTTVKADKIPYLKVSHDVDGLHEVKFRKFNDENFSIECPTCLHSNRILGFLQVKMHDAPFSMRLEKYLNADTNNDEPKVGFPDCFGLPDIRSTDINIQCSLNMFSTELVRLSDIINICDTEFYHFLLLTKTGDQWEGRKFRIADLNTRDPNFQIFNTSDNTWSRLSIFLLEHNAVMYLLENYARFNDIENLLSFEAAQGLPMQHAFDKFIKSIRPLVLSDNHDLLNTFDEYPNDDCLPVILRMSPQPERVDLTLYSPCSVFPRLVSPSVSDDEPLLFSDDPIRVDYIPETQQSKSPRISSPMPLVRSDTLMTEYPEPVEIIDCTCHSTDMMDFVHSLDEDDDL